MKPILFNTEMVQAILDGRKTQTRRIIKEPFYYHLQDGSENLPYVKKYVEDFINDHSKIKIGDVLYVRETWAYGSVVGDFDEVSGREELWVEQTFIEEHNKNIVYYADVCNEPFYLDLDKDDLPKWKPSIHMNKEYARIFLKVINVRVERLQDIEHEDILCEGMNLLAYKMKDNSRMYADDTHGEADYCEDSASEWWQDLWNSTAGDGFKWNDNPFVFVYEFERVEA